MHERVGMFTYQIIGEDDVDMRSAYGYGTGEFDNFVREQKLEITQRLRDLRENPPSKLKHGGRFKSLSEMRNAYAGRDKAIEQLENKLSFLKNEGNPNRAMLLRYDDGGNISGFEVVSLLPD